MKQQKSGKKLTLNKETVTRLDVEEMKRMKGGTDGTFTIVITSCLTPPEVTRNC